MKKLASFLIPLTLCYITLKADELPAIIMQTAEDTGSEISFYLGALVNNTPVQVDFGNGVPVFFNITEYPIVTEITGTVGDSKTLSIYGSGINSFQCTGEHLTYLDVSNDTVLYSIDCYENTIDTLDLSNKSYLKFLNCNFSFVSYLDLTNDTALYYLYCGSNLLSDLDVSACKGLVGLDCSCNLLKELDLENNPLLKNLCCEYNAIDTLDVTLNTELRDLCCAGNYLKSLSIDNDTLDNLHCTFNLLTFKTLPLKRDGWAAYMYAPQYPITIPERIAPGEEIDFSGDSVADGVPTLFQWKDVAENNLIEGTDYSIEGGVTVFLREQPRRVYCAMSNSKFPDMTGEEILSTTYTTISSSSDIREYDNHGLLIYTHEQILTVVSIYDASLSVFDTSGRLILSDKLFKGINEIYLDKKGIFLIQIFCPQIKTVRKILIR